MNCFPGRLEFKKNVQAVTRSLEPRNYAGFRFRWYPQLITYDHINSTPRESLGGRTPYDVALDNYGIDILKALQLRPIPPDEVNLTPKLIRFNH